MATYIQQPVGPMARGENAMARALNKIANSETTPGTGILADNKASNSGANPGTGAPAARQNHNPTYRGTTLNSNMLTGKSTELTRNDPTQKEKQNVGARRKSRKNFRTSQKSSRKFEKQKAAIDSLKRKGLIVKYNRKNDNIAVFVKKQVDNAKTTVISQFSTGNNQITVHGVRTEDAAINAKTAFAVKRNDTVAKFLTPEAIKLAQDQQWSETNVNNIYKLYEIFVNATDYFIDFGRVDPIDFKERAVAVPLWLGLKEFALRYSKPIVRYPGILIRLLSEKDWTEYHRRGITNIIVKIKTLLFGYFEYNLIDRSRTYHEGIANMIQAKMHKTDETIDSAFQLVDSLVTCFKNANALTIAFNVVNDRRNRNSFNPDKLKAFENITAEIGKIIESKVIQDNVKTALGYDSAKHVIAADEDIRRATVMNGDSDVQQHKNDAN